MESINSITGLRFIQRVSSVLREKIKHLEEKNNSAVHTVLQKKEVFLITHNELFRDPLHPLVIKKGNTCIFPPQPFPEFSQDAIMSCPSKKIHELLVEELGLQLEEDEATLLVGFSSL